jgi:hypothetical protein
VISIIAPSIPVGGIASAHLVKVSSAGRQGARHPSGGTSVIEPSKAGRL